MLGARVDGFGAALVTYEEGEGVDMGKSGAERVEESETVLPARCWGERDCDCDCCVFVCGTVARRDSSGREDLVLKVEKREAMAWSCLRVDFEDLVVWA